MKILITGGSGFIGSYLIEELVGRNHKVVSVDIKESRERFDEDHVRYEHCDFTHFGVLSEIFRQEKPEAVCHLGAVPSVKKSIDEPIGTMNTNVQGTYYVLEASRRSGVKRVVNISSGAVYGATAFEYSGKPLHEDLALAPLNPYALSKKMGEEMARLWSSKEIFGGLDTVSLRFSNVFGPRQPRDAAYASCIERFLWQWREKKPFTIVPDGNQRRDMVFVSDVVRAVRLAAESENQFGGEAINIGSGANYSINEIADLIGGKDYPREFVEARKGEIRETLFDISKAKKLLGWQPNVSFEDGIAALKKEK